MTLSEAGTKDDTRTIKVELSASGLASDVQIRLQVLGIKRAGSSATPGGRSFDTLTSLCEHDKLFTGVDPSVADLLSWSRIGPDARGLANRSINVSFRADAYVMVCAWAPIPGRWTRRSRQSSTLSRTCVSS